MSEHVDCEVCIVPYSKLNEKKVSESELRLLSLFFPEIIKEAMVQAEQEKE